MMEPRICSKCDGVVDVRVIDDERGGMRLIGCCRTCAAIFNEVAVSVLARLASASPRP